MRTKIDEKNNINMLQLDPQLSEYLIDMQGYALGIFYVNESVLSWHLQEHANLNTLLESIKAFSKYWFLNNQIEPCLIVKTNYNEMLQKGLVKQKFTLIEQNLYQKNNPYYKEIEKVKKRG